MLDTNVHKYVARMEYTTQSMAALDGRWNYKILCPVRQAKNIPAQIHIPHLGASTWNFDEMSSLSIPRKSRRVHFAVFCPDSTGYNAAQWIGSKKAMAGIV